MVVVLFFFFCSIQQRICFAHSDIRYTRSSNVGGLQAAIQLKMMNWHGISFQNFDYYRTKNSIRFLFHSILESPKFDPLPVFGIRFVLFFLIQKFIAGEITTWKSRGKQNNFQNMELIKLCVIRTSIVVLGWQLWETCSSSFYQVKLTTEIN